MYVTGSGSLWGTSDLILIRWGRYLIMFAMGQKAAISLRVELSTVLQRTASHLFSISTVMLEKLHTPTLNP